MIDRVFDYFHRPCDCVLLDANSEEVRARVLHISMRKAIIATRCEIPLHLIIPVTFDFAIGPDFVLKTRIEGSGANGLFLELIHPDRESENHLQALLIEYSTRERCDEDNDDYDKWFGTADGEGDDSPQEERALRSNILKRTRTVRSRDLAAAHQKVRVVNMSSITTLIHESVHEALESTGRLFDEEERKRLLEEAQDAFQERLSDMQAENSGLIEQASRLEEKLGRARDLLEEERKREVSADQFTMSDAGIVELETRLERIFRKVATESDSPESTREEMREVIATLLDEERERLREKEELAHNEKIQLLEHKVGRLAQALQETGHERDVERHRANALEAMGGGVSGIKVKSQLGDDPEKGRKVALLKELIEDNRAVRNHMGIDQPAGGGRPNPFASLAEEGDAAPSGIKKIEVKRVAPPPLNCSP